MSDPHALPAASSSSVATISALELARLAALLPGADQEPRLAVRRALALLQAAEECLEETREEASLMALALAQDDSDFLSLDEAMLRTGHKRPLGFYKRARELCHSLDQAWEGAAPDAEDFDPATTRVHLTVVTTILAAERKAAAEQKKRRRRGAE